MAQAQEEMLTLVSDEGTHDVLRLTCHELLTKNQFVDVTLSCVDGQVQAHRLVLCAVSGYLYELFTANPTMNPCTHPMVILRDCKVAEVQLALQYVYAGKAIVPRTKLGAVLNAAKELGCESLERVLNKTLQSVPTPSRQMPQLLSSPSSCANGGGGTGIRSLLTEITKAISIKTEEGEVESPNDRKRKRSRSPSPNDGVPQMPKLLRMASAASKRDTGRGGSSNVPLGSAESPSPPILRKMNTHGFQSIKMEGENNGRLLLQHDKAESFVYTNENLNMMFGGENDEDPNGSENDMDEGTTDFPIIPELVEDPLEDNLAFLQRHIKMSIGNGSIVKPYACPYCTHEFARSAHLKRHVRTHTGEKPYKCTYCDKEFSRQDKMKTHISRHLQGTLPTNSSSTSSDSLVRTCYPPADMSQNSGGQVPIKILIPTINQGPTASTSRATNGFSPPDPIQPPSLSPVSFFDDVNTPSITINAALPRQTRPNRQPRRQKPHLNSSVA